MVEFSFFYFDDKTKIVSAKALAEFKIHRTRPFSILRILPILSDKNYTKKLNTALYANTLKTIKTWQGFISFEHAEKMKLFDKDGRLAARIFS